MRKQDVQLKFCSALLFLGLLGGCGSTGTGTSLSSPASSSSTGGSIAQTNSSVTIGRLELPSAPVSDQVRARADWDSRTVVIDVRDVNGILPVSANLVAKIRVPNADNDRFEDEDDNDNAEHTGNDGRPVTLNATYDSASQVYVLHLPASIDMSRKQRLKIKVTATGYKTANGKIKFTLNGSTPSYVGVFLRKKGSGNSGGNSSITLENIRSLAVSPSTAVTQSGTPLRLQVTGTLDDNSTIVDPPAAVSISPAGAQVAIDSNGTYQFSGNLAGVYNVSFSLGAVTTSTSINVTTPPPNDPPLVGFKTGSAEGWATNVAGFLSHIDNVNGGFYDGGWNVAFATVESTDAHGGIGNPAFNQGVVIGNPESLYLYLTDGLWATTYLQAAGGAPGALTATQGNGVTTTSSGDFGHQVLALKFNIDFSNPPAGSNVANGYYLPAGFGSLRLKSTGTSLDNASVSEVLAAANTALSGGQLPDGYSYASLNELLVNLNTAFPDGTGSSWANGHLQVSPLSGYRSGTKVEWANNVAGFLSHIDNVNGGFYDGGWNVAFATVESSAAQGGIGNPLFGQGVVVGNPSSLYLYLTDGLWATTYLQASGGAPGALTATQGNGVTTTSSGDFGQEVLALKFNVDFANPPQGSTVAPGYYLPAGYGSLHLQGTSSVLDDKSVSEILEISNHALAGEALPAGYTYTSLNALLASLNAAFTGGNASSWAVGHLH